MSATLAVTHPALIRAKEIWSERDQQTGHFADLPLDKSMFLLAVHRATRFRAYTINNAIESFGYGSSAHEAVVNMANNKESDDLTAALKRYEAAHAAALEET
jgi:hypothetical protein